MNKSLILFYEMLIKKDEPTLLEISSLLSYKIIEENRVNRFVDIIKKLRIGKPKYSLDYDLNRIFIVDNEIRGELTLSYDESNLISNIEITPLVNDIYDLNAFKSELSHNNWQFQFYLSGKKNIRCSNTTKNMEVASLSKLFLEIKKGNIKLNDKYYIKAEDISYLSLGISTKDIYQEISIRDLLYLSLIVSDNSAIDILMCRLGKKKIDLYLNEWAKKLKININSVKLDLTKEVLSLAWYKDNLSEEEIRKKATTEVFWKKGIGYFIPLEIINYSMKIISCQTWIPWNDLGIRKLIFKGGSAPGVLSYCWSTINSTTEDSFVFSLALNKYEVFSYIEELYLYERCQQLLKIVDRRSRYE